MPKFEIQPHTLKKKHQDYPEFSTPVFRTPTERFSNIDDWEFPGSTTETLSGFSGLKLHYVDVGQNSRRRTALCLHGQKTWSYAFRKTIPYLLADSYRVIAPDFFGFGKSDKLMADKAYSFEFHRDTILALIDELGLENITVIGFDWGAWLGATLPLDIPNKIKALLLGNTMLPQNGFETWPGFHLWKSIQNAQTNPSIGESLTDGNNLSQATMDAYEAPFPTAEYKAAIRRFPNLVPVHEVDPLSLRTSKAVAHLNMNWNGHCVCVAGMRDNQLGHKTMSKIQSNVRNAAKLIKVQNAGSLVFEHADAFMPKALKYLR